MSMKLLIGGSPCTFWSIAQTKNRETEPKGLGWELFKNYLIARDKFKPDFFLYENNKSMAAAIRERITWEFGFEPICLNSALVSAQNRQRLYWVGRREPDGTYSQLPISPPEDRGILLRDILDTGEAWKEKGYALQTAHGATPDDMITRRQRNGAAEPINTTATGKSGCLRASDTKMGIRNMVGNNVDLRTGVAVPVRVAEISGGGQGNRIYTADGKACTVKACGGGLGGFGGGLYAYQAKEAYAGRQVGRRINEQGRRDDYNGALEHIQRFEVNDNQDKTNCLTTVAKDNMVAELLRIGTVENTAANPAHDSKQYRVYSPDAKGTALCGNGGGMGAITGLYAAPCGDCENCKAAGKPVYRVEGGLITIRERAYPIKLKDGCYIIRKLTVAECKRLQTVPDSYVFPVSPSQAYKMLGNGWTVDIIAHLLSNIPGIMEEAVQVLSMYDGMSCGHIALDKLGANVTRYYASEIDKYAIQTTQHNFPETIQIGDAFQVREDGWELKGGNLWDG